jgi:hypothetical protein
MHLCLFLFIFILIGFVSVNSLKIKNKRLSNNDLEYTIGNMTKFAESIFNENNCNKILFILKYSAHNENENVNAKNFDNNNSSEFDIPNLLEISSDNLQPQINNLRKVPLKNKHRKFNFQLISQMLLMLLKEKIINMKIIMGSLHLTY